MEKFKGSATEYINKYIIPTLPENNVLIEFSDSLDNYLKDKTNLRIIRKFGDSKFRGSRYTHQNINYIVSDNEAALWMYMESMEDGVIDYHDTIKNERMPIAFAITKEERKRGLIYNNFGKQIRENEFSQLGYKHCHIFQCSPRGMDLNDLNLNHRMIRLLNPMNHFPFPSNKKFEMPYDYAENEEFLSLVLNQLLEIKFNKKDDRIKFEEFIEKSGSSKLLKNKVEDFEINIGEKKEKRKHKKEDNMNTNKKNKQRNINEINSKNNSLIPTCEQAYFKVSENLYGQNEVIKVTFNNNGAHHGEIYAYDHDVLFDETINHLKTLPVWNRRGIYTSINNIPGWAIDTELIERIK
tara:strand:- start:314 stop:1372 length:1059 start_codon:yes stop_codon:yes gene_type:complete